MLISIHDGKVSFNDRANLQEIKVQRSKNDTGEMPGLTIDGQAIQVEVGASAVLSGHTIGYVFLGRWSYLYRQPNDTWNEGAQSIRFGGQSRRPIF